MAQASGPTLRRAVEADAEALASLSSELGYPATAEPTRRRLQAIRGRDDQAVWVAEVDPRRVVGWVHVFLALRLESEPFAEIGGLVVAAEFRGRGIGRALVEAAEAWSRTREVPTLRVRSKVERRGAHEFYHRLGFAHGKTQAVFVRRLEVSGEGARPSAG